MALDTVILQGRFTSNGAAQDLILRSDVDWCDVYNYTQAATQQATGRGVQFYWQRGMAPDTGLEYVKTNATDALNLVALVDGGFTLIDTSLQQPGALVALTSISGANPPRVTVASTAALRDGDVVRIFNTAGGQQLGGMDFSINVINGTTFDLEFMAQIIAAAGPGSYRVIPFDPIFYPRRRFITSITQALNAVVKLSVTHGYIVGQAVRLVVPAIFGMTQMNGLLGKILAVDLVNNTITLDIDSTAFTAFTFPLTADVPFSPAEVVPVGEDTSTALLLNQNILSDATFNDAFIGLRLAGGAQSPAGSDGDVIFWKAGKSFSVFNQ